MWRQARYRSRSAARDVIAWRLKTFARAGKSGAAPASPLRTRARNAARCQALETGRAMGGGISQMLGRIARSPCCLFRKNQERYRKERNDLEPCVRSAANMALMAAGSDLPWRIGVHLSRFLEGKKTKIRGNKNEPARDGTRDTNQPSESKPQTSAHYKDRNAHSQACGRCVRGLYQPGRHREILVHQKQRQARGWQAGSMGVGNVRHLDSGNCESHRTEQAHSHRMAGI